MNLQYAQNQPEPKQQRFVRLYEPLHDKLCRFVQTLVWDKEDAKDVVSETALRAYEGLEELRSEDAFLSYLFSIASNLIKHKIRRKKFWGMFNQNAAEHIPATTNADEQLLLYELNKALQLLSTKQSQAIIAYEVSGLSMAQIAQMQQITEEGVRTNIHRARKKLTELLEHANSNTKHKGVWYGK